MSRLVLPLAASVALACTVQGQSQLWEVQGTEPEADFGWSLARLPDLDGDGGDELLVGATWGHDPSGQVTGSARVLRGADGAELLALYGTGPASLFGGSVAHAGDVDHDGFADLIVGAKAVDRAYVHSGFDGALLLALSGPTGSDFGRSVGRAGRVDGDATDDLVVGGPVDGVVRVLSGATGAVIHDWTGGSQFGFSVAGIGDVDGDGRDDVAVGSPHFGCGGVSRAQVYSGLTGALLHEWTAAGSAELGLHVAAAGDVDGDGAPDVLVGERRHTTSCASFEGVVHVYSGATGAEFLRLREPPGVRGAGTSSVRLGDVDLDGRGDFLVGAPDSWMLGSAGFAALHSGLDGGHLAVLQGDALGDAFGNSVAAGDFDGDGQPELAVGVPWDDGGGVDAGSVRVVRLLCPQASPFCQGSPNSVGPGAEIRHTGSLSFFVNDLRLVADGCPPNQAALFFYAEDEAALPYGDGVLCLAAPHYRLGVAPTGTGSATFLVDLADLPSGGGFGPGDLRRFQCWYRDPAASGAGFNFSDGLAALFCP